MSKLVLAALLVAVAAPAWAINDEKPQPYTGPVITGEQWNMALQVCRGVRANLNICAMNSAHRGAGSGDGKSRSRSVRRPDQTHRGLASRGRGLFR